MSQPIEKQWGITRCVCIGPHFEVWHAVIQRGGASSVHLHERKGNQFYVLSGELQLYTFDGHRLTTRTLCASDTFYVPPGKKHRFIAMTDVELIEVYSTPLIDSEDIVRENFRSDSSPVEQLQAPSQGVSGDRRKTDGSTRMGRR